MEKWQSKRPQRNDSLPEFLQKYIPDFYIPGTENKKNKSERAAHNSETMYYSMVGMGLGAIEPTRLVFLVSTINAVASGVAITLNWFAPEK